MMNSVFLVIARNEVTKQSRDRWFFPSFWIATPLKSGSR